MRELRCPKCGSVFTVDEADYASIANQVRGAEFEAELERRLQERDRQYAAQQQALQARAAQTLQDQLAQRDRLIYQRDTEIARLGETLRTERESRKLEIGAAIAERDRTIEALKADASRSEDRLRIAVMQEQQRAGEALQRKDSEISGLKARAEVDRRENLLREKALRERFDSELKAKDDQVAFYKDFKARKTVKLLGEDLEQHCYRLYSQTLRPVMPSATFEKDNEAVEGTKGDFIFRDSEEGVEYVSIMFEMKNEGDGSSTRHRNSDFFDKLDKDRTRKGCEFAVLVSMLEMDNDLYNDGIVVAPGYDRMYVVRPENFIPIITLLVQTSKKSFGYKKELMLARSQSIDVTNFEQKLHECQVRFAGHYDKAEKYFAAVIEDIDKSIRSLERIKSDLTTTGNQLRLANNAIGEISIKRLTRGNPTMKALFEDARTEDENLQ